MKCLPSNGHIQCVGGRGGTTKIVTRSFHEVSRFDSTNKSCGHRDVSVMFKGLQQSCTHTNTEATKMRVTINQNSCRPDQEEGFLMNVTHTTEAGAWEYIMDTLLAD